MDSKNIFRGFHEEKSGLDRAFYNGEWHNGEWVIGHLIWYEDERAKIVPRNTNIYTYENNENVIVLKAFEVATETVSQCTGLHDDLQVKIYQNDIVMEIDNHTRKETLYTVEFGFGGFRLSEIGKPVYRDFYCPQGISTRVIGNKFSKPELLEVKNEQ